MNEILLAATDIGANGIPNWANTATFIGTVAGVIVILVMTWRQLSKPMSQWRETKAADRAARESEVEQEKKDL